LPLKGVAQRYPKGLRVAQNGGIVTCATGRRQQQLKVVLIEAIACPEKY